MAAAPGTIKAVVVRGTFMKIGDDGARIPVLPGKGKESEVEVTESQLASFSGVLVRADKADAEVLRAAQESMAPSTPTNEAIASPSETQKADTGRRNR